MNDCAKDFCKFILEKAEKHDKHKIAEYSKQKFSLIQDRKVYYNNFFAVRFNYSKNGSFSNTVISLSALQKYDKIPFFVVLVTANSDNKIFLANSTLIHKVSHSSQSLAIDNIRGSFNGSDIIKVFQGIKNIPENFEDLFAIHEATDWDDNLQRLCETSSKIKPKTKKYIPTRADIENIFGSISRAKIFVNSNNYLNLKTDLDNRVKACKSSLILISKIDNNNIKGRLTEILITSDEKERLRLLKDLSEIQKQLPVYDTKNALGDYEKTFDNAHTYVDIKIKVVYLNSNPKAFNIDKFLQTMALDNSVFLLYFIGFDEHTITNTALCSVYHSNLINSTIVQPHWAGRLSRGCAQYKGKTINTMLNTKHFVNNIDTKIAKDFLQSLIN